MQKCNLVEDDTLMTFTNDLVATVARSPSSSGLILHVVTAVCCFTNKISMVLEMVLMERSWFDAMPSTKSADSPKGLHIGGLGKNLLGLCIPGQNP